MRVLFDIVHPADVLFFKRPIEALMARGDEVSILSRVKDVTCDLLDEFGLAHQPASTAGQGIIGLAAELITRDFAVLRAALSFKPDVMIGFGGTAISHVGLVTRTKTISFYDTEEASLQNRITWPFISALYVPQAYDGPTPAGRTVRVKGTKDLSYLHPAAFQPDVDKAVQAGLARDRDNYFIRVVSWRANHDLGKTGWSLDVLRAVVAHLSQTGCVHLSSEEDLPDDLRPHAYAGDKTAIHHLMAHCRLYAGESTTMASEAAILGVPAIYAGGDLRGYVTDLEAADLIRRIETIEADALVAVMAKTLAAPPSEARAKRDAYVSECPDWAEIVVDAIDLHGGAKKKNI